MNQQSTVASVSALVQDHAPRTPSWKARNSKVAGRSSESSSPSVVATPDRTAMESPAPIDPDAPQPATSEMDHRDDTAATAPDPRDECAVIVAPTTQQGEDGDVVKRPIPPKMVDGTISTLVKNYSANTPIGPNQAKGSVFGNRANQPSAGRGSDVIKSTPIAEKNVDEPCPTPTDLASTIKPSLFPVASPVRGKIADRWILREEKSPSFFTFSVGNSAAELVKQHGGQTPYGPKRNKMQGPGDSPEKPLPRRSLKVREVVKLNRWTLR
jgi:hypothetical protein